MSWESSASIPLVARGSEETTDVVGGIGAADMAHKGWTYQPLQDGLTPFHDSIFDSMPPEKRKDLLRDLVSGVEDTQPYDDRTETPLLIFSRRCMGEEAGWIDGTTRLIIRVVIRSTILGPTVSQTPLSGGVIDSTERLDSDVGVSADGLVEGFRPVNEFRVVAAPGDAVNLSYSVGAGDTADTGPLSWRATMSTMHCRAKMESSKRKVISDMCGKPLPAGSTATS